MIYRVQRDLHRFTLVPRAALHEDIGKIKITSILLDAEAWRPEMREATLNQGAIDAKIVVRGSKH